MSETKIMPCSCLSDFQDKTYGKNLRLFNQTRKSNSTVYRCTVCGKEK
jgi:hypothetical protein